MSDEHPAAALYRKGVGIMLLNRSGKLLLGRRSDIEGGAWQLPQGGLERGEQPAEAALRELKEEIGSDRAAILAESKGWYQYDLPEELRMQAWGGRYRGQRLKWFLMRFSGDDNDIDVTSGSREFNRWIWVPPSDAPALVVSFKQPMYLAVMEEFRSQLREHSRSAESRAMPPR